MVHTSFHKYIVVLLVIHIFALIQNLVKRRLEAKDSGANIDSKIEGDALHRGIHQDRLESAPGSFQPIR